MRRPTSYSFVTGIWAAIGLVNVVASKAPHFRDDLGARGPQQPECHRSFPSFFWAGTQAGEHQKLGYQHASRDVQDVTSMLVEAAGAAKSVDVAVVVLSTGSFSTSGVSDANAAARAKGGVHSSLHCRSATTTFPYTYPASTAVSEELPMLAAAMGASVQEVPLRDVVSTVSGNSMLTDGKLDFIVATVPVGASIEETDTAVRSMTAKLQEETGGRFLLLWTGDFHGEHCGRRALAAEATSRRRLQEAETEETETEEAETKEHRDILMTSDILAGVLVMILFVFVLNVGYGCVGDIECPQSFPKVNPAKGREY